MTPTRYSDLADALSSKPRPLGLHACSLRRVEAVASGGLSRRSAAWFVLTPRSGGELERTLAAAVYHGLTLAGCEALCSRTRYVAHFLACPESRPAFALFELDSFDPATANRYYCSARTRGLTCPYTNVGRAGARVPGPALLTGTTSLPDLLSTERAAGARDGDAETAVFLVKRTMDGADVPGAMRHVRPLKLVRFCVEVAAVWAARVASLP